MKKLLLGTSALIGAVAVAASASAQEPLSVTLGGYLQFDAASVKQDSDGDVQSHDFRTSTEVHVRAEGTTDAGLTYGAVIELEGDGGDAGPGYNSGNGSENHIYLSGGWGKVELGDKYGVASTRSLMLAAPGDFGLGGVVAVEESYRDFIVSPATGGTNNAAAIGWLGSIFETMNAQKSTKVTYYSPVFNGLQVGASYTPEGNSGEDVTREETTAIGVTSIIGVDDFDDYFEAAALWNYAFGNNVGLGLSGTYVVADAEDHTTLASQRDDLSAFSLGANVTFGGFTVGMSYTDLGDSGLVGGASQTYDDTDGFTFGVQYETGPFVVGANYLMADSDANVAGEDDIEYDALSFGGSWAVAPGFVTYAEATFFDLEGDVSTTATSAEEDGSVVVLGTRVSF